MHTSFNVVSQRVLAIGLLVASGFFPEARALNILTCEPEWKALAQQIAPHSKVYSATSALQDPHHIEARPGLIAKMRKADLVICSGADLEVGWLPLLQMKSANTKVQKGKDGMFYAAEQIDTIGKVKNVNPTMGDVHPEGNPHFHLDPYRLLTVANALAKRMVKIDPDNAQLYKKNISQFDEQWQKNIRKWEQEAQPLKGIQVVAYHTSFEYLFQWLGISMVGDLEPKPGLPPSGKHLSRLLKLAKDKKIDAVVYASYQDKSGAEWLSKKIGVPAIKLPMSINGSDNSQSLAKLYDDLINKLLKAVKRNG
ncbi:zinc ABC transporter substrate-binding protein [Endozoicomonas montiporae]|uniref:Zinc ABC transporter substrate-binding protein n=2 Tax=Endozoicomonas montiporae TaxID=1027273 RepID=A0A081N1G8_9GAMM|nr:zinc ABC transporter substrate-binding protein [Endozoicomonas montiporae]AMO58780.1 zinc/manganese transport system substrate-binding protein [Endozoicomonas montiporae CL-33]KEQ12291.1 zinc ABC transporter substrate-binding protein [Endozoicomonas montiporae]